MAASRLEKIGTIYSRATGLLNSGAMQWEDRPLWYDVYKAFPPKEEPYYSRPTPNVPLRKIFYSDDKIRALFHKHNKQIRSPTLTNNKYKTLTQRFIVHYRTIEKRYDENTESEQIYKEAIELLKQENENKKETIAEEEDVISLSEAFKTAQNNQQEQIGFNIKNIFKE